jgi:hypothetical protein
VLIVRLFIYTFQYDARCIQRQNNEDYFNIKTLIFIFIFHIFTLITLHQINTDKFTHILLIITLLTLQAILNMFQPLKSCLQEI